MSLLDSLADFLFSPVVARLDHLRGIVMGNTVLITELSDKVEQLTVAIAASNAKSDALITLVADLRRLVADHADDGGADAAQLRAILAKVDAGIAEANEQKAQNEAALADPDAPAA